MKKTGILLLLLSFILIFLGIYFVKNPTRDIEKDNISDSSSPIREVTPENSITQYNTNPGVLSEHCFEGVCYTILSLDYNYDAGSLMVNIRNASDNIILQHMVKFVFDTPDGEVSVSVNCPKMAVGEISQTESKISNSNLLSSKNYTIIN